MPLVHVNGIEGIETGGKPILTDIATPKKESVFYDYSLVTDGEFYLQLKGDQRQELIKSFPNHTDKKVWSIGRDMYYNAMYNGLHGTTGNTSIVGYLVPELYEVQRDIEQARKRFTPAGESLVLVGRDNVGIGTNPIIKFTDFKECDPLKNISQREYDNCVSRMISDKDLYWKQVLNQHLERSSHHLLYEFQDDAQAGQMRATKAWKTGQHQQSISLISDVSRLSRANVVEWHRLGIMRHNALKGAGALPPYQTIEELFKDKDATFEKVLKAYKDPESGQNVSIGFIPAAAYIIFACAAALVAVAGVIQAINKQEPTALDRLAGIGKAIFSAEGGDNIPFIGNGGNDNGNGNNDTGGNNGDDTEDDEPKEEDFFSKYKTPLLLAGAGLVAYSVLKD